MVVWHMLKDRVLNVTYSYSMFYVNLVKYFTQKLGLNAARLMQPTMV